MQRSEFCEALKKNAADIQFIQLQTNHIPESLAEMSRRAATRRPCPGIAGAGSCLS
jgi:hypothetical protein